MSISVDYNQLDFSERLYRLKIYYSRLVGILESFYSGYLIMEDEELNRHYLKVCNEIDKILDTDGFENLRREYYRPKRALYIEDPDGEDINWEYGGRQDVKRGQSLIEELFIQGGEKTYHLPDECKLELAEMDAHINKYLSEKRESWKNLEKKSKKYFEDTERNKGASDTKTFQNPFVMPFVKNLKVLYAMKDKIEELDKLISERKEIPLIKSKLEDIKKIEKKIEPFIPKNALDNFSRHIYFVEYFFTKKQDYEWMESNCKDMLRDVEDIINEWHKYINFDYFDDKLKERSFELVMDGKYDTAIREAFIVVETRIKDILLKRHGIRFKGTPKDLIDKAFSPNEPLLKLGEDKSELEGIYFLYRGCFQLFRGEVAHGFVNFDYPDMIALLYLTDLLLKKLQANK